jgi:hypothetical protein
MSGIAPYIVVGTGYLFAVPSGGNLASNATPLRPFTVQDFELTVKGKIQKLQGLYNVAEDIAKVDQDVQFKFSMGRRDFFALNQMYYSDTFAAGGDIAAVLEAHTIPGSSTYTVTIAPPGSGTFVQELAVEYAGAFGGRFIKVASVTAVGQYSVVESTGVFTFFSGDASAKIQISYEYLSAATGTQYQFNGQIQGFGPSLQLFLYDPYIAGTLAAANGTIALTNAKLSEVSYQNSRDNYGKCQISGEAAMNNAGLVSTFYSALG